MDNYYWHGKKTLYEEMNNVVGLKNIYISTAFLSQEGVNIISELVDKFHIKKENINIFISSEFSLDKPHALLTTLNEICNVFIVFKPKLHAKVFLLKGTNECKIIFGSANLTKGGMELNIEFDSIKIIEKDEETHISYFFDYCKNNSVHVDEKIIEVYRSNYSEFEKFKKESKKISNLFNAYINKDDPFEETDYELDDMYFNFADYETLFPKYQKSEESGILKRRKAIQGKMLHIHERIKGQIEKEGIHPHWNIQNITSSIQPNEFNKYRVNWLGIRYGKSKEFIKYISDLHGEKVNELSFPKHACLQYNLTPYGFEINLFHAVRNNAVDRQYMLDNIGKKKSELIERFKKLKGKGYKWIINREENNEFNFDIQNAEDFISFYIKNDADGFESYLCYYIEPDNLRLKDLDSICNLVVEKIEEILPLYWLMSWNEKTSNVNGA